MIKRKYRSLWPSAAPGPAAPRQGAGRVIWLGAIVVGAAIFGAYLLLRSRAPDPRDWEVPAIDARDLRGPVERALSAARDSVAKEPGSAEAWGEYGMVLDAHKQYELAAVCYQRAHQLAPEDFRWVYFLAIVLDFQGADLDEVVSAFDRAIRLRPDYTSAHYRHAEALTRQGRLEQARLAYLKVLALAPKLAAGHRGLGQLLLALGDARAAVKSLSRAAHFKPDEAKIYLALARAYVLLGQEERAEQALEESKGKRGKRALPDPVRIAIANLAVNPQACVARAQRQMRGGNFAKAIRDFERFEEMLPEHAGVQYLLGICYAKTGRPGPAIDHLSNAVRLDDTLVQAHVQLAGVLAAEGQREQAIEHYRRALVHQPGDGSVRQKLRELGAAPP